MNKAKILSIFLVFVIIVSVFSGCKKADPNGITFEATKIYYNEKVLPKIPVTFEATVLFPKDFFVENEDGEYGNIGQGGVIIGNCDAMKTAYFTFMIYTNGNPKLTYVDDNLNVTSFTFTEINVFNGELTHVAIAADSANEKIHCYINGELKQSLEGKIPEVLNFKSATYLGGELSRGNEMFFRGQLKTVALYSDVRSAEEVKADFEGNKLDKDSLIGYYDLTKGSENPKKIKNQGDLDYDFVPFDVWVKNQNKPKDYDYSVAVIGDTQSLTYYFPEKVPTLYDWIRDNAKSKKMQYVLGLGDITEKSTDEEWALSMEQFKKLDGVVPSRFIRGNHDTPLSYIKNFPYSEYKDEIEGSYDGTMRSTYQFITLGGQKYMLLVLDSFADAFLLNWANDVVEDNPDCKVIVATHAYLDRDGTLFESSEAKEATGDIIWDRFAKKHKNIVLILSGHVASDRVITRYTKGDNGNTVTQMLINPQMTDHSVEGGGFVAMLYFKKGSDDVQVEYYSTVYDKYFLGENQYTIQIDMD